MMAEDVEGLKATKEKAPRRRESKARRAQATRIRAAKFAVQKMQNGGHMSAEDKAAAMEAVALRVQARWRGRQARARVAAMQMPWAKQGDERRPLAGKAGKGGGKGLGRDSMFDAMMQEEKQGGGTKEKAPRRWESKARKAQAAKTRAGRAAVEKMRAGAKPSAADREAAMEEVALRVQALWRGRQARVLVAQTIIAAAKAPLPLPGKGTAATAVAPLAAAAAERSDDYYSETPISSDDDDEGGQEIRFSDGRFERQASSFSSRVYTPRRSFTKGGKPSPATAPARASGKYGYGYYTDY